MKACPEHAEEAFSESIPIGLGQGQKENPRNNQQETLRAETWGHPHPCKCCNHTWLNHRKKQRSSRSGLLLEKLLELRKDEHCVGEEGTPGSCGGKDHLVKGKAPEWPSPG